MNSNTAQEADCKSELLFDEAAHEYSVDGVKIPCVSDVIAPLGADFDDADIELAIERAADRGVTCHAVIAEMLYGNADVEYPGAYSAHVDAISLFLSEHTITPLSIETPLYSPRLNLAGTPDLLCEYDGVLTVVDYKFVSQIAKSKVKAQLNAYRIMYEDLGVFPEQLIAVQFLPNGLYRPYPVAIDNAEIELCMKLHELKNKKHSRGKID